MRPSRLLGQQVSVKFWAAHRGFKEHSAGVGVGPAVGNMVGAEDMVGAVVVLLVGARVGATVVFCSVGAGVEIAVKEDEGLAVLLVPPTGAGTEVVAVIVGADVVLVEVGSAVVVVETVVGLVVVAVAVGLAVVTAAVGEAVVAATEGAAVVVVAFVGLGVTGTAVSLPAGTSVALAGVGASVSSTRSISVAFPSVEVLFCDVGADVGGPTGRRVMGITTTLLGTGAGVGSSSCAVTNAKRKTREKQRIFENCGFFLLSMSLHMKTLDDTPSHSCHATGIGCSALRVARLSEAILLVARSSSYGAPR